MCIRSDPTTTNAKGQFNLFLHQGKLCLKMTHSVINVLTRLLLTVLGCHLIPSAGRLYGVLVRVSPYQIQTNSRVMDSTGFPSGIILNIGNDKRYESHEIAFYQCRSKCSPYESKSEEQWNYI